MAYKPGSQIRQFFKTGGITLTDKSEKYTSGKIPLFKSLKGLNARERLYAVGYNLSTLGGFGLNFGQMVSIPYMIGEYTNTARSVIKNLKQPSNILQGQFIKRQKLLAGAKSVGKGKSALSKALRTGTPIDRATNVVLGRESAGLLGSIREFGTAGAVLNVVQEANASKIDAEIQRQAALPTKDNVFRKWQTMTFVEAFKLAPNPFYDNPVRKAEKIRHRTVETKGQEFNIDQIEFGKNLAAGIDINRASGLMSLMDAQNFAGGSGFQDDLVSLMLDAEGEKYFSNRKGREKYASLSRERRLKMYEEAHYTNIGGVMRSGSQQVRDYKDRDFARSGWGVTDGKGNPVDTPGVVPSNTTLDTEIGPDGKMKRVQDIIYNPEVGRSSNFNSRKVKDELNTSFLKSFYDDIGAGGDVDMSVLSGFEMGPDVMNGFKKLARAFNLPIPKNVDSLNATTFIDTITTMATTVSNLEIKQGFFVGGGMRITALEDFVKTLRKNGYSEFAKSLKSKAGYRRKNNDPMSYLLTEGGFLGGRNKLIQSLQHGLNSGVLYQLTTGMPKGEVPMDFRFQPSGAMIDNAKYSRDVLRKNPKKIKFGTKKIHLPSMADDVQAGSLTGKAALDNVTTMSNIDKLKRKKSVTKKAYLGFVAAGTGESIFSKVKVNQENKSRYLSYEDLLGGHVPGMKVKLKPNGKFHGLVFDKKVLKMGKDNLYYGKPQEWYVKKVHEMHKEFSREIGKLNLFPGMNLYDIQQAGIKIRKASHTKSITRKIEKMRKDELEIRMLSNKFDGDVVGDHVRHRKDVEKDFRGTSNAKRHHDNYVPTKGQIRKSIHMHDLEKFGTSEDGTPYLFRYSVTAGGMSKQSKVADAIRDIASIEFGGFAHDKNMKLEKRTDGMFYTPSHFMGIAGTKAAAYLGIWDKGAEFKTKVDGANFAVKMSGRGSISPFDIVGTDADGLKTQVRKDVASLKKGITQGNARLTQLSRDLSAAIGGGGSVRNNSEFSSRQARIASNRALALYRKSGQFGNISGGDIFTAMDDIDRANLGLIGDKVGSNYKFNQSSLGTYSAGQRRHIGTFKGTEKVWGQEYSYKSGDDHFGKMYTYRFKDLASGQLHYGEMPVVPMLNTELIRLKNIFTSYGPRTSSAIDKIPNTTGGPRVLKTNWDAFSEFTGLSPGHLKKILYDAENAGVVDLEMPDFRFDTTLNPSNNANVRKIFESPAEELVSQFGLNKINGPLKALNGKQISTNSPGHPANVFKEIFLTGEMAKHIQYNTYQAYKKELGRIIATADDATKKILERTIRQYAREDGERFMRSLNKILQNNLTASVITSEHEFRKMLMRLQFTIKYARLNATKHATTIKSRYGRVKPIAGDVAEDFLSTDARIDPETFNSANFRLDPDEGGFQLHIPGADGENVVRELNLMNLTQKEIEMIEFYDPLTQMIDNYAVDPRTGAAGPKVVRDLNLDPTEFSQHNMYSQAQAQAIIDDLARQANGELDPVLVEHYTDIFENEQQYGGNDEWAEDVPRLKGKYRAGVDVGVSGIETVRPNSYKSTTPSMDNIVREFSNTQTRLQKVTSIMQKAKRGINSHSKIANEYWKATRHTIRTMNEVGIMNDLIELTTLRAYSGINGSQNVVTAAEFIKEFWYASVPAGIKGGRNFLQTKNAGDASALSSMPPEYTKLISAFKMAGFVFPRGAIHKSETHGHIAILSDDDFHKIALLLLKHGHSQGTWIMKMPSPALRYASEKGYQIGYKDFYGDK